MMPDLLIGFAGSLFIAGAAYLKRSLSRSGLWAAVFMGTWMYAAGSLPWFGTLIAFFITSSLLSKWKSRRKTIAEKGYAKSGQRDAGQVFANGGIALLLCIANSIAPHPLWWAAFVGVMATVTADTWATEIGGLSPTEPRSIVNGRKVSAGTSGGVTPLGLAASAAGGFFIGAAAWWLMSFQSVQMVHETMFVSSFWGLCTLGLIGGLIGSLADSWLGAVCQVMYRCSRCGQEIEKNRHCDAEAVPVRGLYFMTNDAVNALSSAFGGGVSVLLAFSFLLV